MADVLALWDPAFSISLLRDYVLPVLVGGVMLVGIFWLVGYLVTAVFRWMQ